MNWKNECIFSCDETTVQDFLTKHLRALNVDAPDVRVTSSKKDFGIEIYAGSDDEIGFMTMQGCENSGFAVKDIRVHEGYRGRSIGPLLVKAGLGAAAARGKTHLIVENVGEDGLIFWHKLGSVHQVDEGLMRLFGESVAGLFEDYLAGRRKDLEPASLVAVMALAKAARKRPLSSLRLLANSPAKTKTGELVSLEILRRVPTERRHILLPGEPATRGFLQKRLGPVPEFEDVSGSYDGLQRAMGIKPSRTQKNRNRLNLG
jgi:ribosomal protein S18 acetylase RimI-like enzyme